MIGKDVKVINYSKRVDFWNCITHVTGSFLSVIAIIMLLSKAEDFKHTVTAIIYGISLIAVYTMSSVYHGLPCGEIKRKARIADHCTVPVLIAGTATPCALITLYNVNVLHGLTVLLIAWSCTLFGIFSKLFFFEKLKTVTITVYISSGTLMLLSVIPILSYINTNTFSIILIGCVCYLIGAALCGLGIKKPYLHIVFHIFVLLGSIFHFFAIYMYMY